MSRYRKTNHLLTIDGETKLLIEWAEESGNSQELIRDRLNRGWDVEEAVFFEPRKYKRPQKNEANHAQ